MKYKIAVLFSVLLCFLCLFGITEEVKAEEAPVITALPTNLNIEPYAAYLTVKEDTTVHIGPGTAWQPLGMLKKGIPAIATGKSDNGWIQIYYIGLTGYVPGDSTEAYQMPQPTTWSKIPVKEGMVINALGDSITYGDKLADVTFGFPHLIAAHTGNATLNNYGWKASAIGGNGNVDRFIDRYWAMNRDADVVLVLGGTNDYAGREKAGVPVGALGDMSPDTFYGSLNLMMCGLKQMYPDRRIIFMTPIKRVGYLRKNQNGYYLNQYVVAVQEMAAFYGIQVLDLFNEPELDFSTKASTYLVDGLHPNETGHRVMAAYIYNSLFE